MTCVYGCQKDGTPCPRPHTCHAAHAPVVVPPKPEYAPDNDGWIEWSGGDCPVLIGTVVEVRLRNGFTCADSAMKGHCMKPGNWGHTLEYPAHIIAYRVIKKA